MTSLGEFDFIAQYLAPLAAEHEGAFGLKDDAARLTCNSGLVVTTDTLVQDVHFRKSDPWDLAIRKAVRVNLSDLAAMGATPQALMLSLVWPDHSDSADMIALAGGLAADLTNYGVPLIGGDSTRGGDRLILTITAFGECEKPVRRSGADAGDDVYVSGTIGDASLGLNASWHVALSDDDKAALEQRYLLPEPRHVLAAELANLMSAAIDVSDGLVADAAHVAEASGLALELHLAELPLSDAAKNWVGASEDPIEAFVTLATSGDDYELLFCAPTIHRDEIKQVAAASGVAATRIGRCFAGNGVALLDASGKPIEISRSGFTHF
ncbi:thiamine-phosphate kinase [Hyphobacterium sp.]|uniref:thiamine-phosphate kinase n=1 Tax=Hyphobacterium sp. TaxID=2004662 RepID=UPI003B5209B8